MEWQEILDKFNRSCNGHIDYGVDKDVGALLGAVQSILQKLASEEAREKLVIESQLMGLYETKQEPVKDERLLIRKPAGYIFFDFNEDYCLLEKTHNSLLAFGRKDNVMILDEEMVRALLPLLQEFVEKGEIG